MILVFSTTAGQATAQVGVNGGSGMFYVDKAGTLGHKNLALSAYVNSFNYGTPTHVDTDVTEISASVTLGILDNLEISVQAPYSTVSAEGADSESGMSDGIAKLKWNFHDSEKYGVLFSAIGSLTLPLGDKDKGLGSEDAFPGLSLAIDKVYDDITWSFNFGFINSDNEELGLDPKTTYGVGVEYFPNGGKLALIGEVSGYAWNSMLPYRDDSAKTALGLRYFYSDCTSLSAGYSSWGGGDIANYQYLAGITVSFGGKRHSKEPESVVEPVVETAPVEEPVAEVTPEPELAPEPEKIVIVLESVHFMFDKSDLTDIAKQILERNAEKLKTNPGVQISIEGNTCSIGSTGYNKKLGLRRAISAKKYLMEQGLYADRIAVMMSNGEEAPQYPNDTKEGRKLNRRVDFVILVK